MSGSVNLAFGDSDACLHCLVWQLIEKHAPKGAGGAPIYRADEIIPSLLEVVAEIIASHPRDERRRLLKELPRQLQQHVADKVRTGDFPKGAPATAAGH